MVKDLPYPYTSKAQYERSIDTPLGTEWNTRVGFQRGTLPKVVKKVSRFHRDLAPVIVYLSVSSDGDCYRPFGEDVLSCCHRPANVLYIDFALKRSTLSFKTL